MKEYKLLKPIEKETIEGEKIVIDFLKFENIKAKHFKFIPKELWYSDGGKVELSPEKLIPLVAGLSNKAEIDIQEIELDDFMAIITIVTELLGESKSLQAG